MRQILGADVPECVEDIKVPTHYRGVGETDGLKLWLAATGRLAIAAVDDLEARLRRLREEMDAMRASHLDELGAQLRRMNAEIAALKGGKP
jgi:hypothetical protein